VVCAHGVFGEGARAGAAGSAAYRPGNTRHKTTERTYRSE